MPLLVCGRDQLSSHAGCQEVSRCSTRGESQGMCVTHAPLPSVNEVEPTLALKPWDVTRSPKQGYQWPHKKDSCPPKIFWKKFFYEFNFAHEGIRIILAKHRYTQMKILKRLQNTLFFSWTILRKSNLESMVLLTRRMMAVSDAFLWNLSATWNEILIQICEKTQKTLASKSLVFFVG